MIRSYILRGSNFLLPFKMFYQQQTLDTSFILFFLLFSFLLWRKKIDNFNFWLTLKHSVIPWLLRNKKYELDIWNGYERFVLLVFNAVKIFPV